MTANTPESVVDVRPVRMADATQMAAILNEIIDIGGTTAFEDPVTAQDMRDWYITEPTIHCCHVALDNLGEIAGYQALEHSDAYGDGIGEISSFARQTPIVRGVGSALFKSTVAAAKTKGLREINAKIRADNVPGLAYYAKMGFQDHSVLKDVPLKDGTRVDRILKRFSLS